MWWKNTAFVAILAITACGSEHYRNSQHPAYGQAEFDRDNYECQRENTHQYTEVMFGKAVTGPNVDDGMARTCMRIRGWYAVSE